LGSFNFDVVYQENEDKMLLGHVIPVKQCFQWHYDISNPKDEVFAKFIPVSSDPEEQTLENADLLGQNKGDPSTMKIFHIVSADEKKIGSIIKLFTKV